MKIKFNITGFILFLLAFFISFGTMVLFKVVQPEVKLYNYINNDFYLLLWVVILTGLLTQKYYFSSKKISKRKVNNRIYLSSLIILILTYLIKYVIYPGFYGPKFLLYFIILLTILETLIVYLYYAIARSRNVGMDSLMEIEKLREEMANNPQPDAQTKTQIVSEFVFNNNIFEWINTHTNIESEKTSIFATSTNLPIELLPRYSSNTIVNLRKVNDITRINRFFELVNDKLPQEGYFIGLAETIETRNAVIRKKYIFPINKIVILSDFIINRVLPKINLTQEMYFSYTQGVNRALSKTEILGRLYSCGFEVVDCEFVGNRFLFCVKKIKNPVYDTNPTYGPFVSLRRVGKNKKILTIYKLRTMYPYSEYIQKYVYDMQGTSNGDKADNDFRITSWGHIFRKFWLDELPMFINLMRGDVKIVGVRPLSKTKFNTYPVELQEKRTKTKPGLIPPFYADVPSTQEGFYESEDRYLEEYFKSPVSTDVRYFFKAMYNIIFKKARSK